MAVTCPECTTRFRLSEALCEDWRDPDRALGCPHCGVFLRVERGPERTGLRSAILGGFCGAPAGMLFAHGYVTGDAAVIVLTGVVMFGVFGLWYADNWGRAMHFVPSGYRQVIQASPEGR